MKKVMLLIILLTLAAILGGCTLMSGVFTLMSSNSTDHSIGASYASFNGFMAQRLSLKEGDTVTFSYTEDDNLKATVKQDNAVLCDIADSSTFAAPKDGTYEFSVEGQSTDGAFSLSWEIDQP